MKKILSLLTIAISVLLFVSCSSNSPKGVVENYLERMSNQDVDGMLELIYFKEDEVEKYTTQYKAVIEDKVVKEHQRKKGIVSYKVVDVQEISEDKATVKFKYTFGDGDSEDGEVNCIKVDGKWMLDGTEK